MHTLLTLFFEMVICKLTITTFQQYILEKNYSKVHYPVMTTSLLFPCSLQRRKQSFVKNITGQSSPINVCLHYISHIYI